MATKKQQHPSAIGENLPDDTRPVDERLAENLPQQAVDDSANKTLVVQQTNSTGIQHVSADDIERLSQGQQMSFKPEEVAIPFLRVVQSNSPHATMGDPKFNTLARPGMFVDTVTDELFDGQKGVIITPLAFQIRYTEWWPRNNPVGKKGLVHDWGTSDERLKVTRRDPETNRDITPDGTQVVKSGSYYVYLINPETGAFRPMLLVLQGTQLKKSKAFNALISGLQVPSTRGGTFNPASFYMGYRVTTVPEKNDKGQWMGVQIGYDKPVIQYSYGSAIFMAALEYKKLIEAGAVKTGSMEDLAEAEVTVEPATADGGSAF